MEIGMLFGVEAMKCRRSTEANRHSGTAGVVQATQPHEVVRFTATVDTVPYPFQPTAMHHCLEAASCQMVQDLTAARYPTLAVEQGVELWVHDSDRHGARAVAVGRHEPPVDNQCRATAKCRHRTACLRADAVARRKKAD